MQDTILLETTTYCNLDCIFCYRGQDNHHKIYNSLSVDEVRRLFDRNSQFMDVSLVNKGEFFMNPQFREIFAYVIEEAYNSKYVSSVFLFTNYETGTL